MAYKICLDAGHFGRNNRSPVVPSYYESEMNWTLHNLLKKELEAYGFEVIQTRKEQTKDLPLYDRGQMSKGCDLFLSIHSNACNTESVDYPVAIVQLDGKGDVLGQKIAEAVQKLMGTAQYGRIYERKNSNGGEYYGVLRGAASVGTMGIIIEHSFHTNTKATKWLLEASNLAKMAKEEAKVIADHFGVKKPSGVIYRVQVGAYTERQNAEAMLADLKKAGFDGYITTTAATTEKVVEDTKPVEPEITFAVGDTVKMSSGATVYGKTEKFYSWVYKSTLYVREVAGNRIVVSTQKTGAVTGAVDKKYLTHA